MADAEVDAICKRHWPDLHTWPEELQTIHRATIAWDLKQEKKAAAMAEKSESKNGNQPERRALKMADAKVRLHDEDGEKRIVGYASVFYDGTPATEYRLWDDMVERIMPGTFDRALAEKDDVRGLFNHDPDHVLGRTGSGTMSLAIDKRGLSYEIEPGDTTMARDVVEHIKRGDVDGSSFAFRVTDEDFRKEDDVFIREIRGVRLFDVGPVTFPAYEASTTGFRANEEVATEIRATLANWLVASSAKPKDTDPESLALKAWAAQLDSGKADT